MGRTALVADKRLSHTPAATELPDSAAKILLQELVVRKIMPRLGIFLIFMKGARPQSMDSAPPDIHRSAEQDLFAVRHSLQHQIRHILGRFEP